MILDTEGTFRPERYVSNVCQVIACSSQTRIAQIAERFGRMWNVVQPSTVLCDWLLSTVNPEETQENILYARALNSEVGTNFDNSAQAKMIDSINLNYLMPWLSHSRATNIGSSSSTVLWTVFVSIMLDVVSFLSDNKNWINFYLASIIWLKVNLAPSVLPTFRPGVLIGRAEFNVCVLMVSRCPNFVLQDLANIASRPTKSNLILEQVLCLPLLMVARQ